MRSRYRSINSWMSVVRAQLGVEQLDLEQQLFVGYWYPLSARNDNEPGLQQVVANYLASPPPLATRS